MDSMKYRDFESRMYQFQSKHINDPVPQPDPDNHNPLEKSDASAMVENEPYCSLEEPTYTIPVVVHVLHSSADGLGYSTNVSDGIILNLIKNLNDGYRNRGYFSGSSSNKNPAVQSVDIHFEFKLATFDKNQSKEWFQYGTGSGLNGICRWPADSFLRITNSAKDIQMKNAVRGFCKDAFPVTKFLNIYIVPQCDFAAGYAYMPDAYGQPYDGVVILTSYTSSADHGVTLIHEVGHYFGLYHTFENDCNIPNNDCLLDGDRVCDTPPQEVSSSSRTSCGNSCINDSKEQNTPFTSDQPDLCEDYMDYSLHSLQNTFTNGQKQRMHGALLDIRKQLLNWNHLLDTGDYCLDIFTDAKDYIFVCDSVVQPQFTVKNNSFIVVDSFEVNLLLNGNKISNYLIYDSLAPGKTQSFTLPNVPLTSTLNLLEIELINIENGVRNYIPQNAVCYKVIALENTKQSWVETTKDSSLLHWFILNPDNRTALDFNENPGCSNADSTCLFFHSFTNSGTDKNQKEYLISPVVDISNYERARLRFDRAYTTSFDNYNTVLDVNISTDCGLHFQNIYSKTQDELATVKGKNYNDWSPTNCNQWMKDSLVLDSFIPYEKIMLQFVIHTDSFVANKEVKFGNNLFLDNIEVALFNCPEIKTNLSDTSVCGNTVVLDAGNFNKYYWNTSDSTQSLKVDSSGWYFLNATGPFNCHYQDSAHVNLYPIPEINLPSDTVCCSGFMDLSGSASFKNYWSNGDSTTKIRISKAGIYYDKVKSEFGCVNSDTVNVRFSTPPDPPVISKNFNELESSKKGNGNQWYRNGVPVSGATHDYIVPKTNGIYTVTYTNPDGCTSDTSAGFNYQDLSATDLDRTFIIRPNPFEEKFEIIYPGEIILSVKLTDYVGREISFSSEKDPMSITIKPVEYKGIFFVQIVTETGYFTQKMYKLK